MNFERLKILDEEEWNSAARVLIPYAEKIVRKQSSSLSPNEITEIAVGALQEVIRSIQSFTSEVHLRYTLARCSRCRAIDRIREKGKDKSISSETIYGDLIDQSSASALDALVQSEQTAELAMLCELLPSVIDELSVADRQLLAERYSEDLTHAQIAALHNWSVASIGNRLGQSLARARHLLLEKFAAAQASLPSPDGSIGQDGGLKKTLIRIKEILSFGIYVIFALAL